MLHGGRLESRKFEPSYGNKWKKKNSFEEVDSCAQILFQAEAAGAKRLFNLAEIHDQN